ncbi:MAG: hypothetical protein AAGH64_03435 [Planctomycetota bacterium]
MLEGDGFRVPPERHAGFTVLDGAVEQLGDPLGRCLRDGQVLHDGVQRLEALPRDPEGPEHADELVDAQLADQDLADAH